MTSTDLLRVNAFSLAETWCDSEKIPTFLQDYKVLFEQRYKGER